MTGTLEGAQSHGSLALVDSRVRVQSGPVLENTDKAVVIKNSYFLGATTLLQNASGGALETDDATRWTEISQYAYAGPTYDGVASDVKSHYTLVESLTRPLGERVTFTQHGPPPADLAARHFLPAGFCDFERTDVAWADASPDDTLDDTAEIQAALDRVGPNGTVFLRAGRADANGRLLSRGYRLTGTLALRANRRLCGVAEYSTKLFAPADWRPGVDSAMVQTDNSAAAAPGLAHLRLIYPEPRGSEAAGWAPHVYPVLWQAGHGTLLGASPEQATWGNPGEVRAYVITGEGGGKLYGIVAPIPYDATKLGEDSPKNRRFYVASHNPLTIFPAHLQFALPRGGAMAELDGARNVSIFASKNELASTPEKSEEMIQAFGPALIPSLLHIRNSQDVSVLGMEGLAGQGVGRALVELKGDNHRVLVGLVGSRNPTHHPQGWFFVKDDSVGIVAQRPTGQDNFAAYYWAP